MLWRAVISFILLNSIFVFSQTDNIQFKGISFSAANKVTTAKDIRPIADINANYISIVPYGFLSENTIKYDSRYQWVGERPEAIRHCVQLAHEEGLQVMLKPHIWIGHGTYTGHYVCETEEEWKELEESYHSYILEFVKIAQEEKVAVFSIGTEWGAFVEARPKFWKSLIKDVRAAYDGKVVYAANWDDYQDVSFWEDLDYIGIDSYFPLSEKGNPRLSELIKSWREIMPKIEAFALKERKKVIFTEFGFKSTSIATVEPWVHKDGGRFSEKVQNLAYKSFFATVWKQSWFAGGFVWKWYHNHSRAGGQGDRDFTPQNKLAEETIRRNYGLN